MSLATLRQDAPELDLRAAARWIAAAAVIITALAMALAASAAPEGWRGVGPSAEMALAQ